MSRNLLQLIRALRGRRLQERKVKRIQSRSEPMRVIGCDLISNLKEEVMSKNRTEEEATNAGYDKLATGWIGDRRLMDVIFPKETKPTRTPLQILEAMRQIANPGEYGLGTEAESIPHDEKKAWEKIAELIEELSDRLIEQEVDKVKF